MVEEEKGEEGETVGFEGIPNLLALAPKSGMADLDYAELMKTTLTPDELAAQQDHSVPSGLFNYNTEDDSARSALLERFELVRKRRIDLRDPDGKPLALIFNPYVSGSVQEDIQSLLFQRDVKFELITCEG